MLEQPKLYNHPFQHFIVDDFLPEWKARGVVEEISENSKWDIREDSGVQVKWRSNWESDDDVPVVSMSVIQYLNSGDFLRWLSSVTGVDGLIPDPYLTGGGFNVIKRGGLLAVHADGNWHDLMQVHRRLNVILFLNDNWEEDWGGHLEFWDNVDGKPGSCVKSIAPIFNRLVVFKTDDFSFHGHPHPLDCPSYRDRKSLILYYYTSSRPEEELASNEHHRAQFHV